MYENSSRSLSSLLLYEGSSQLLSSKPLLFDSDSDLHGLNWWVEADAYAWTPEANYSSDLATS
jgi:hypothetical protein